MTQVQPVKWSSDAALPSPPREDVAAAIPAAAIPAAAIPANADSPALLLQKRLEDAWSVASMVPPGDDITMTRSQLLAVVASAVACWAAIGAGGFLWFTLG